MNASLKKSGHEENEYIRQVPSKVFAPLAKDGIKPETKAHLIRAAEEMYKEAAEKEKQARALDEKVREIREDADDLMRRSRGKEASPQPVIGRWEDLKIGDALWAYMKQLDFDDKRLLTEVADALLKAGVDPGSPSGGRKAKNRTPQKTMIANIRKSAIHRGCKCDEDRFEDDKIWRVRTP